MNIIDYKLAAMQDIEEISAQIAVSYKAAYKGLMSEKYLSSLEDDHWVPILQDAFSKGHTCVIALDADKIIGSAVFGKEKSGERKDTAELFAIYLLPEHIGLGIGRGLYLETEREMRAQRFKACLLEALRENKRAVSFYLAFGYRKSCAFEVAENGMTLKCIVMEKEL